MSLALVNTARLFKPAEREWLQREGREDLHPGKGGFVGGGGWSQFIFLPERPCQSGLHHMPPHGGRESLTDGETLLPLYGRGYLHV